MPSVVEALRMPIPFAHDGREGRLGGADGAQRTDRRRFVTGDAGPQQAGDRDGGDDADDRHDDQQLDECETLLITHDLIPMLHELNG